MISIFTFTLDRELYLRRLVKSLIRTQNGLDNPVEYEHHIIFQGTKPSFELETFLTYFKHIILHKWEANIGAGEGNNKIFPSLKGDLIVKLDDDSLVHSYDYFNHITEINNILEGKASFSPYPVGLIGNPGGVLSQDRHVLYGENTDTYYTFRKVPHLGGFGRVSPRSIMEKIKFPNDFNPKMPTSGFEDTSFSRYCNGNNTPLYYLENAIVIEHQESTLGQHERYGETYFKSGRF